VARASLDSAAGRKLFSHWATGVSVLTSVGPDGPRGLTANAVCSLSLEPLRLLACFEQRSNTLEAVRDSGRFCVNMLAAGQEALSRHFAQKGDSQAKFGAVSYTWVDGMPVLDGCLAWMVCDVTEELEGGDHAIVIGAPLVGGSRDDAHPLVFFRSVYHAVVPPQA
jgi:3-hydroxy-9,10-secoandrosta-1,3,5(10)-triene-9,17-dione monooxygenase reductase component